MKLSRIATATAACAMLVLSACSSSSVSAPTQAPSLVSASSGSSASSTSTTPAESPSSTSSSISPSAESPTPSGAPPATEAPAPAEDLAVIGESCGLLYGKDYLEATLVAGSITCSDMIAVFEQDMAENSMDVRLTDHQVGNFTCRTNDWDTALQQGIGTQCSTGDNGTTIISKLNSKASSVDGRSPNLFTLPDGPATIASGADYQHTIGPRQPDTVAFFVNNISCYIIADGTASCKGYESATKKHFWFSKAGYGEVIDQPGYGEGMATAQKELPQNTLLDANGARCARELDDTISCTNADGSYFSYGPHGFMDQYQ